ncbi:MULTISPECIES: diacylglycerol kinase family protein [Lacticaseibacillus]|uniref:Diacylglycerol kinase family protein n=2 Tax=Lacticaseibacillus TaxID=2759736 RepID=A0ABW4CD01_9LACO|nr:MULTISPECIES: diacylglycerol kinase family protein [Lacticaseibacillus]
MASSDKRIRKNHSFFQALRHAIDGLWGAFIHEGNLRREFIASLLVVIGGAVLRVSWQEWLILMLAILGVILGELINTIVEQVVDLIVGPRFDPRAKKIKDMAAGAVLVTAGISVVCGIYVFVPHLVALFGGAL